MVEASFERRSCQLLLLLVLSFSLPLFSPILIS
jgi:hypothetical protein